MALGADDIAAIDLDREGVAVKVCRGSGIWTTLIHVRCRFSLTCPSTWSLWTAAYTQLKAERVVPCPGEGELYRLITFCVCPWRVTVR